MLDAIQKAGLFPDSKTFVDMPAKLPAPQLLAQFYAVVPQPATKQQLSKFVADYFLPADSDVVEVIPADWSATPAFLKSSLSFLCL